MQLSQARTNMGQNILLVLEGVLQQLRISREQGPFLWGGGAPSHQMGFGAETVLAPYLRQHLSMLLSVFAGR